ncbi:ceroid-lipofuscinosis neuronal protein 5-like [Haliotis rufescens]|uniref:ceroid-lipofuscinosis neuronal protein 5-like n=1 Tax=Haliotis rufescens TaxID=6454 RepID=UPI00201F7052|nr:ceroid-lipofuscinosis neuronal protein 5-like [Haliotis rufescens]
MWLTILILFSYGLFGTTAKAGSLDYTIPHRRFDSRPPVDPRCKRPFDQHYCFDGEPMATFNNDDVIVIYSMTGNGGPVPGIDLVIPQHAGIGLHNLNTGFKYTLDWSPMFGPFNCSQPNVLEGESLLWCNQAESCFRSKFTKPFLKPRAERHQVANTTGKVINAFALWVTWDNNTGIYGDSSHLMRSRDGPYWTETWDCGTFVQRAFQALYDLGVRFYPDFQPSYWLGIAYTERPEYLGSHTEIFGVDGDAALAQTLMSYFKADKKDLDYMYLHYNEAYWYAKFTSQAPEVPTKMVVPLPGYE